VSRLTPICPRLEYWNKICSFKQHRSTS